MAPLAGGGITVGNSRMPNMLLSVYLALLACVGFAFRSEIAGWRSYESSTLVIACSLPAVAQLFLFRKNERLRNDLHWQRTG